MSKEWFILQFKPNAHHKAEMNLNRQGFETFLPLSDFILQQNSRFTKTTKPLFPGYMFIAFDNKDMSWVKINNTYGVSRLITFSSTLKAVPTSFISNLMNRCDSSGKLQVNKQFKKGDQVKILNGPFTNFIATVETLEADKRIWILMDLMGRETKFKIDINNLKISH